MMTRGRLWLGLGLGLSLVLGAPAARADVWDQDPLSEDDGNQTDNELYHGTVQVHDLAAQGGVVDEDWYVVRSRPFSSYEVLVDSMQGEIFSNSLPLDLVDGAGTVLVAGANPPGGLGSSKSLRWANETAAQQSDFVRTNGSNTSCTTTCSTNTQYTIRMWETTLAIPRFNNSGSQITVLLLQNPSTYSISGRIFYWNSAGGSITSAPFTIAAKALLTVATASVAPGGSGSITITNNGRFGDLVGKAVALEPSTGFSFDTLATYKAD